MIAPQRQVVDTLRKSYKVATNAQYVLDTVNLDKNNLSKLTQIRDEAITTMKVVCRANIIDYTEAKEYLCNTTAE